MALCCLSEDFTSKSALTAAKIIKLATAKLPSRASCTEDGERDKRGLAGHPACRPHRGHRGPQLPPLPGELLPAHLCTAGLRCSLKTGLILCLYQSEYKQSLNYILKESTLLSLDLRPLPLRQRNQSGLIYWPIKVKRGTHISMYFFFF